MAQKNYTEVLIDGKIYQLGGIEDAEYIQKVAAYLNGKIGELKSNDAYRRLGLDMQHMFLDINIVDDFFKAKKAADELAAAIEEKDRQLYNLKQEIVDYRLKNASYEEEIKKLNEKKQSRSRKTSE